jgi:aspartate kinase
VKEETPDMESVVVRGVSLDREQAKITVAGVPDRPGFAARIFSALAAASINIDMIIQNISAEGVTDISFTVGREEMNKARLVIEPIARDLGCREVSAREGLAKVSIVGIGMKSHSGVAASMFESLAEKGINIEMISTSEIKISVIISEKKAEEAVLAVHKRFGLGTL